MTQHSPLPDLTGAEGYCAHCGAALMPPEGQERHGWLFQPETGELRGPAGQVIRFTVGQARLFEVLWRRFGTNISREVLTAALYSYDSAVEADNVIATQLSHIRRRIADTPFFVSVSRGFGNGLDLKQEHRA